MRLAFMASAGGAVEDLLTSASLPDTGRLLPVSDHSITFDKVTFAYPDGRVALREVSFTAPSGGVTALVGPSGAGKSTVARLLPRFFDVDGGSVRLGGVDVRDMALAQLMDSVAFVFQEAWLFSDTVAANLRVGRPGATSEELVAAAKAARAHDFVSRLPAGYDTPVGEGGARLSGGERQRLAIARALLKDAPVVVLDEATAFLDPEHEAAVQDAISALASGRTLVVVAHRLPTITRADHIVVLDRGRVTEQGRHEALLAHGGLYRRLWDDHVAAERIVLGHDRADAAELP